MPRVLLTSPIGLLLLAHDGDAVTGLSFWRNGEHPPAGVRDAPAPGDALGRSAVRELQEYLCGTRRIFSVPVRPPGTAFQGRAWAALSQIPYGETRTYGQLAAALGIPGGARALGQASARNPIPILVPCHRVLASGGAIGGYAGEWGEGEAVDRKRWLLRLERPAAADPSRGP